ncbi:MAG TPA: small acid-soluble spore protein SspJ [Bacillales bacterium]|nr:small acid-soluble spore protein SspJ [Bacillales bacterium]
MAEERNARNVKDQKGAKQEGLNEAKQALQNDPLQEAVEKEDKDQRR